MFSGSSKQFIVLIGPAGSGKTSLAGSFGRWVEENVGLRVGYINLDPGVEELPYSPDVDVRRWVRIRDVMRDYGLGPNGAFLKSMELISEISDRIFALISNIDKSYIIVDTPGQMELFVFRDVGPLFISRFREIGFPIGIVLFDPTLTKKGSDIVSLLLMSMLVQFRLDVESIPIISKCDQVLERLLFDESDIIKALSMEKGLLADLASDIFSVLSKYRQATRIISVSAKTHAGFNELYDMIHEIYCTCGDLT